MSIGVMRIRRGFQFSKQLRNSLAKRFVQHASLIVGCAPPAEMDAEVILALKAKGIVAEVMDIGAACRTYNVLRAECRQVAAALVPAGPPPDKKP